MFRHVIDIMIGLSGGYYYQATYHPSFRHTNSHANKTTICTTLATLSPKIVHKFGLSQIS